MMRLRERIRRLFFVFALTPSQIDASLKLARGTAHDVIVEYWIWEDVR